MVGIKKYTKDFVKKAVKDKFGTIKNYADSKGVSRAAMSERISNPSSKFVYELKKDGIIIDSEFSIVQSGRDSIVDSKENGLIVERHKVQIELLKEQLKEAYQRIAELERRGK